MKKVIQFINECRAEMGKVVWPSRPDVMSSAVVVLVSTIIIAIILGLLDTLFVSGMNLIF
jgi:preprotein translocase subunit SecE